MAEILRVFFVLETALVCICASEADVWTSQLRELKTMITALDAKVSALDSKIANVQFLEYAFKVSNVAGQLGDINATLRHITTEIDSIKNATKLPCQRPSQLERISSGNQVTNEELMEKIEHYGQKCMLTTVELLQEAEKQRDELENTKNLSRSGFTKLYRKVDQVLEIEGQMTLMSRNVNAWSPKLTRIEDQVADISVDVKDVKGKFVNNEALLLNVSDRLGNAVHVSTTNANNPNMNEALETATGLRPQMTELIDASRKFNLAAKSAQEIQATLSSNLRGRDAEAFRNLVTTLTDGDKTLGPLLHKFSGELERLHAVLSGNRSRTHSNENYKKGTGNLKQWTEDRALTHSTPTNPAFGCATGFAEKLSSISKSAADKIIVDKLQFISNELSAIQSSVRKQCNCTLKRSDLGLILG